MSEKSIHTIRFGEKVIIGTVDNLILELDSYISKKSISKIVFDLENVIMCDSYGLTFFVQARQKSSKANIELVLYRPNKLLKDILENTKLINVFTIVETLD